MLSRSVGVALVLLAIGGTVAMADVLRLRDGQVIEGTISAVTDTYVTIVTDTGTRDYPVVAIESIERGASIDAADGGGYSSSVEDENAGDGIHPTVGIGVEVLAGQPLLAIRVGFQGLNAGAAGTMWTTSESEGDLTMSMTFFLFTSDIAYCFPLIDNTLGVYIGGGVDGGLLWLTEDYPPYFSISAVGVGLGAMGRAGLQVSLFSLGVPIVFYGGASWLSLQSITISADGYTESIPVGVSGLTWHIGVMIAF